MNRKLTRIGRNALVGINAQHLVIDAHEVVARVKRGAVVAFIGEHESQGAIPLGRRSIAEIILR